MSNTRTEASTVFLTLEGSAPVQEGMSAAFTLKLVDAYGLPCPVPKGETLTIDLLFGNKPRSAVTDSKEVILAGNYQTSFLITPHDGAIPDGEARYLVRIRQAQQSKGLIPGLKIAAPDQAEVRLIPATGEAPPPPKATREWRNEATLAIEGDALIPKGSNAVYKILLNRLAEEEVTVDVHIRTVNPINQSINTTTRQAVIPFKQQFCYFMLESSDSLLQLIPVQQRLQVSIANPRGGGFDRIAILINSITSTVIAGKEQRQEIAAPRATTTPPSYSPAQANRNTPPRPAPAATTAGQRAKPVLSLSGPSMLDSGMPFRLSINLPPRLILEDLEVRLFCRGQTAGGEVISGGTSLFIPIGSNYREFRPAELEIPLITLAKKLTIEITEVISSGDIGPIAIDPQQDRITSQLASPFPSYATTSEAPRPDDSVSGGRFLQLEDLYFSGGEE